jgi:hypothetical protein
MIDSFKLFRIGVMKIQFLEASAANAMQGGDHCGDLAGCSDWSSDAWLVLVVGRQGYTMHECLSDARCPKERRKFWSGGLQQRYFNDTSPLPFVLQAQVLFLDCVEGQGTTVWSGRSSEVLRWDSAS